MSRNIFLLGQGNQLVEMREQPYDSEDLLQELLANHPALLAGDQMNRSVPRRWLLIAREMSVPSEDEGAGRWSVDHLFIDQDGVPTVIEVKRSSDTRIRREVVGQMLEYAANAVVHWPIEALRARFESSCQARDLDADEELDQFLGGERDAESFWGQVKTNLRAGKIRLVFVADEISTELKRIIEFLNEQMDPAQVLGVEIKQYVGQNLRTLVPSVIGQTEEAQQRKSTTTSVTPKRQWNEQTYFEELQRHRPAAEVDAARRIFEWMKQRVTRIWWGKGTQMGSFVPVLAQGDIDYQLLATYTYGSVEIYFQTLRAKPAFESEEKRLELLARLNAIPGVSIPRDGITRRPVVKLSLLADEQKLNSFLKVYEWVIEEITTST